MKSLEKSNEESKPRKKTALDVFLITVIVTSVIAFYTLWVEESQESAVSPDAPKSKVEGPSSEPPSALDHAESTE